MEFDYPTRKDLKFLLEAGGRTVEEIASETGFSVRTIESVALGETKASDQVNEKIYSLLFDQGYSLNRAKEETLAEKYGKTLLFHGSKKGLKEIVADGSRANCDFGTGFYLGERFDSAASFVFANEGSSVYAFSFDPKGLKGVEFECDLEWMLLVCAFRGTLGQFANHPRVKQAMKTIAEADYIKAPIADNRMFFVMDAFAKGDMTDVEAIHCLSASSLGEQTVIKTKKAIKRLVFVERFYLCQGERKRFAMEAEERSKLIETKLKYAKREFRGEGQYIDELLS